jgi:hypothetical protein
MNIILGTWYGYKDIISENKGGLFYFMKSLRNYNSCCKVILWCSEEDIKNDKLIEFSKKTNFELYNFNSTFMKKNDKKLHNTIIERFIVYKKILDTKYKDIVFEKILISDIDDVIFQGDPFSINFKEDIYCGLTNYVIWGQCNNYWANNKDIKWILQISKEISKNKKEELLYINNVKNKYVCCAGTILGKYNSILKFLNFYYNINFEGKLNDQGLFNFYIYNLNILSNKTKSTKSKIITLCGFESKKIIIENNQVLNENKEKYIIVHQLNRYDINNIDFNIKNNKNGTKIIKWKDLEEFKNFLDKNISFNNE